MEKRLLAELFQPVEKSLIVIGGANGSGKSTLVKELELNFAFAHLDPDRIVMAGRQSAAGREAIALRSKLFKEDDTFGLETTLSGKAIGTLCTLGLTTRRHVSSELRLEWRVAGIMLRTTSSDGDFFAAISTFGQTTG